jgi:hypothetical protein
MAANDADAPPPPDEPDDGLRTLQALSRGDPGAGRVNLRERRDQLAAQGPGNAPLALMDEEQIRIENAELSIFFIEDTWRKAERLLSIHGHDRGLPVLRGDRLVPLSPADLGPAGDPLTALACHAERFLLLAGALTERELIDEAFRGLSTRGALHVRYRDVLARLAPPQTPLSHAIANGFAGLQMTLALVEVLPEVTRRERGTCTAAGLEAALRAPAFERLVLALAGTRAAVGNALLSLLAGEPFQRWQHCLHRQADPGAGRLRFDPGCFTLGEAGAPRLRPEVVEEVGRRMSSFVTLGRHRQIRCPALFAESQAGTVARSFVRWLVDLAVIYYLPTLPP